MASEADTITARFPQTTETSPQPENTSSRRPTRTTEPSRHKNKQKTANPVAMALEQLYVSHCRDLVRYLGKHYGAGPPDPEDVAHRAFMKMAELGDLRHIKNLPGFLWRTARNVLISEKRALAVRENRAGDVTIFAEPGYDFDPERVLLSKDDVAIVARVVNEMPKRRRQIFLMSRVDGLNNAEIGRRLGIARPAVSRHVSRALMEVNAALQGRK